MGDYTYRFNPLSGDFDIVQDLALLHVKDAVDTYGDLPIAGNYENDARFVKDTDILYVWTIASSSGNLSDWKEVARMSIGDLDAVDDGLLYGRVLNTELTANYITTLRKDASTQLITSGVLKTDLLADDGINIQIDEIRARDADGLKLYDDAGNGIFIADGGDVSLSGTLSIADTLLSYTNETHEAVYLGTTGLDDLSSSGVYSGASTTFYEVKITGVGTPNDFAYREGDSGAFSVPIVMTGAAQLLQDGIYVTFGATTGHRMNDVWHISVGYMLHFDKSVHLLDNLLVEGNITIEGNLKSLSPVKIQDGILLVSRISDTPEFHLFIAGDSTEYSPYLPDAFKYSLIFETLNHNNPSSMHVAFWEKDDNRPSLVLNQGAVGRATVFERSVLIGASKGTKALDTDYTKCDLFPNLVCDTTATGAELGVEGNVEFLKNLYLGGNLTDGTNASSPADIKDAVDKKHTQDTDTAFIRRDGTVPLQADWDIGGTRKIMATLISARDFMGLRLFDSTTGSGIYIADGGNVHISKDLIVDTDKLFVDVSNGSINLGKSVSGTDRLNVFSPSTGVQTGIASFYDSSSNIKFRIRDEWTASSIPPRIESHSSLGFGLNNTKDAPFIWYINDTGNEKMRLTSTGLGIGVISPSEKLDVDGNIKLSGNIIVAGTVDGRDISEDGTALDDLESAVTKLQRVDTGVFETAQVGVEYYSSNQQGRIYGTVYRQYHGTKTHLQQITIMGISKLIDFGGRMEGNTVYRGHTHDGSSYVWVEESANELTFHVSSWTINEGWVDYTK